jgi:ATP-binding cassette, subfamily C (CFTR/MRP), member 1
MPAVTFTVYAIAQKVSGTNLSQFSVAQAFTALSLLNVLVQPVMDLTVAWTNLSSALACLDRIQNFILKESRDDYRILVSHDHVSSSTQEPDVADEKPKASGLKCAPSMHTLTISSNC